MAKMRPLRLQRQDGHGALPHLHLVILMTPKVLPLLAEAKLVKMASPSRRLPLVDVVDVEEPARKDA
jgi:hypothetical protein